VSARETTAQFYARNAAAGRTVRLSISLNMNHVPESQREALGTGIGTFSIKGGTLTPDQAKRILAILNEGAS